MKGERRFHSRTGIRGSRALHQLGLSIIALVTAGYEGGVQAADGPSPAACESMAQTAIRDGTVVTAQLVTGGTFSPPGSTPISGLPDFCRVTVTMEPTSDSNINVEVWMPTNHWNGRFLGTGNGGQAGTISYASGLREGLIRGFAVANTDLGTHPNSAPPGTPPDATTWVGHPERWEDFGYRANHEMTIAGKTLVAAYYQRPPDFSYFQGCSTGGQQAISIAQQYPTDYNGILAGAAANNRTHLNAMFLWNFRALQTPGAQLTAGQRALISNSVVAACAGKDGGSPGDSFLTDPRQCHFDPSTLPRCTDGTGDSCLTDIQINALRTIYEGPVNPRTGQQIFAPPPVGSENAQLGLAYQQDPTQLPPQQFYQYYWTFGADYDYTTFDFDRDMHEVDEKLASILNANDPNLRAFEANGGKLIQYGGTFDGAVPFADAINYYERVTKLQGDISRTRTFYRYFPVPGMDHCLGGPGLGHFGQPFSPVVQPDEEHDALLKLTDWVETGNAPEEVLARAYTDSTTDTTVSLERPICAYPQLPVYQGGDRTQASSFHCVDGPREEVLTPARRYLVGRKARRFGDDAGQP